jgi:RNA polymerase sigma factor (TIGR02999 family)
MSDVTQILSQIDQGDPSSADLLLPLVYDELRKLATARLAHEERAQTLSATALVHEAYLRLVDTDARLSWNSRGHFFAAAAEAMRRILLERARHKKSLKGGGNLKRVDLLDHDAEVNGLGLDLLALDEALQVLERSDPRACQVIKLRFFGGLTISQTAETLGISVATADNDWAFARSWLRLRLTAQA